MGNSEGSTGAANGLCWFKIIGKLGLIALISERYERRIERKSKVVEH